MNEALKAFSTRRGDDNYPDSLTNARVSFADSATEQLSYCVTVAYFLTSYVITRPPDAAEFLTCQSLPCPFFLLSIVVATIFDWDTCPVLYDCQAQE